MVYCGECKEECKVITVDDGIGSYEFWGARGCDVRLRAASDCCEGDVYEDKECKILWEGHPWDDEYPDDYNGEEECDEQWRNENANI